MQSPECQIHCLQYVHEPITVLDRIMKFRLRVQRFIKRRIKFLSRKLSAIIYHNIKPELQSFSKPIVKTVNLNAGDTVRIRSRSEIQATLNSCNRLKGCAFMEEMVPYCATTQRVYKRIEHFLDERDYLVKKCNGIFILEGVFCHGTADFGRCDRTCFFFWREEWLEKVN
jgi:hypothetical protein